MLDKAIKSKIFWIPLLVSLATMLIIYLLHINERLFYIINSSSKYIGNFWGCITIFGDGLFVAILLIPFLRKRPHIVWAMLWTAILFNIVLHSLKSGLNIPRPPFVLPEHSFYILGPKYSFHSFPSGHTATAFAIAGTLIFSIKNDLLKTGLFLLACLVGLSRIGVGVHWPADVCAGVAIGWASAWIGRIISKRISIKSGFVFQLILGLLFIMSAFIFVFDYDTHYPMANWLQYSAGIILLGWGIVDYVKIIYLIPLLHKRL